MAPLLPRVMGGDGLTDAEDSAGREEEKFYRSMYFGQLNAKDRQLVRSMRTQVERMVSRHPEGCEEEEEDEEEDNMEEKDTSEEEEDGESEKEEEWEDEWEEGKEVEKGIGDEVSGWRKILGA